MSTRIETPEGARWGCRQCGFCCRFVELGPVEPAVIAGLMARDVGGQWAPAAGGWYEEREGPGGQRAAFLKRVDGACVFLRQDNLCAVHALYGEQAKPGFCRAFPFHAVEVPGGVAVVARADCSGLHESFQDGAPVAEQAPAALLAPRGRYAPEAVEALPGHRVPLATWEAWQRALIAAQRADPLPPEAALARIRGALAARLGIALPAPDEARLRAAGAAALEGFRLILDRAVSQGGGSPAEEAFARETLARVQAARAGWARLEAPPQDTAAYLDLLLRSALVGRLYRAAGEPPAGLGLFLLGVYIARASAGGPQLDPLARHLSRWQRFTGHQAARQIIRLARPALVDLFLNASG
jgi:Fe-S-cluster containining protein